jgi:hypothetical protein
MLLPALAYAGDGAGAIFGFFLLVVAVTVFLFLVGVLVVGRGRRLLYALTAPLLVIAYLKLVYYLAENRVLSATAAEDVYALFLTPAVPVFYAVFIRLIRWASAKHAAE